MTMGPFIGVYIKKLKLLSNAMITKKNNSDV